MSISENFYIGLDVGRTIRGALVSNDGRILKQQKVVAEVSDPRLFISQLVEMINQLRLSEEAQGRATAVGIGWAGLVNQNAQRIEVTPNIVDASAFDLHNEIDQEIGRA